MIYYNKEENTLIKFIMEDISRAVEDGLEEEPKKFTYTRCLMKAGEELDINLSKISEVTYEHIIGEIVAYLKGM